MMEEKRMEYRWPKTMSGEEAKLLFGGDYNPDQWSEAVWEEDVRLMKKAKVNVVTVSRRMAFIPLSGLTVCWISSMKVVFR